MGSKKQKSHLKTVKPDLAWEREGGFAPKSLENMPEAAPPTFQVFAAASQQKKVPKTKEEQAKENQEPETAEPEKQTPNGDVPPDSSDKPKPNSKKKGGKKKKQTDVPQPEKDKKEKAPSLFAQADSLFAPNRFYVPAQRKETPIFSALKPPKFWAEKPAQKSKKSNFVLNQFQKEGQKILNPLLNQTRSQPLFIQAQLQGAQEQLFTSFQQKQFHLQQTVQVKREQAEQLAMEIRASIEETSQITHSTLNLQSKKQRKELDQSHFDFQKRIQKLGIQATRQVQKLIRKASQNAHDIGEKKADEAMEIGESRADEYADESIPDMSWWDEITLGPDYYELKQEAKIDAALEVGAGYEDQFLESAAEAATSIAGLEKGAVETIRKSIKDAKAVGKQRHLVGKAQLDATQKEASQGAEQLEEEAQDQLTQSLSEAGDNLNAEEEKSQKHLTHTFERTEAGVIKLVEKVLPVLLQQSDNSLDQFHKMVQGVFKAIEKSAEVNPHLLEQALISPKEELETFALHSYVALEIGFGALGEALQNQTDIGLGNLEQVLTATANRTTRQLIRFSKSLHTHRIHTEQGFKDLRNHHQLAGELIGSELHKNLNTLLQETANQFKSGAADLTKTLADQAKSLEESLAEQMSDIEGEISDKAEEAADAIQPLWKTIAKIAVQVVIMLVVAVIIIIVAALVSAVTGGIGGILLVLVIAIILGALGGMLGQLASDAIDGQFSGWQMYTQAAIIGAIDGAATVASMGAAKLLTTALSTAAKTATRTAVKQAAQAAVDMAIDLVAETLIFLVESAFAGKGFDAKALGQQLAMTAALSGGMEAGGQLAAGMKKVNKTRKGKKSSIGDQGKTETSPPQRQDLSNEASPSSNTDASTYTTDRGLGDASSSSTTSTPDSTPLPVNGKRKKPEPAANKKQQQDADPNKKKKTEQEAQTSTETSSAAPMELSPTPFDLSGQTSLAEKFPRNYYKIGKGKPVLIDLPEMLKQTRTRSLTAGLKRIDKMLSSLDAIKSRIGNRKYASHLFPDAEKAQLQAAKAVFSHKLALKATGKKPDADLLKLTVFDTQGKGNKHAHFYDEIRTLTARARAGDTQALTEVNLILKLCGPKGSSPNRQFLHDHIRLTAKKDPQLQNWGAGWDELLKTEKTVEFIRRDAGLVPGRGPIEIQGITYTWMGMQQKLRKETDSIFWTKKEKEAQSALIGGHTGGMKTGNQYNRLTALKKMEEWLPQKLPSGSPMDLSPAQIADLKKVLELGPGTKLKKANLNPKKRDKATLQKKQLEMMIQQQKIATQDDLKLLHKIKAQYKGGFAVKDQANFHSKRQALIDGGYAPKFEGTKHALSPAENPVLAGLRVAAFTLLKSTRTTDLTRLKNQPFFFNSKTQPSINAQNLAQWQKAVTYQRQKSVRRMRKLIQILDLQHPGLKLTEDPYLKAAMKLLHTHPGKNSKNFYKRNEDGILDGNQHLPNEDRFSKIFPVNENPIRFTDALAKLLAQKWPELQKNP